MKFYAVSKNADTVEGRGPMVNVANFKHFEHAKKYVEEKSKVYNYPNESWWNNGHDWHFGFFTIEEKEMFESEYDVEQEEISQALNKLSAKEIILLHKHFRESLT
jgi:hypothetical protein